LILEFLKLMDFKMEVYILRHAISIANEKNLVCGSRDYPLSETGIKQANRICNHLQKIPFTLGYSSPLSRSIDTIKYMKEKLQFNIVAEISEVDTGDASHMTFEKLWSLDNRYRSPWLHPYLRYPAGECFYEMINRIQSWFLNESNKWKENDIVLIVGHEGTLRSILLNLLNLKISEYPTFPIKNCDYFHLFITDGVLKEKKHLTLEDIG